ncbi:esterase [Terribacillus saccharophilus]|uniref:hotdog fold thioesterase n=1 Tax=Terribacillus saccharophilus TaxID=361277 RepID=UPI000BA52D70|nr:hotdog fold thioesterase [Terribacillus saccharophilus]PAF18001.1 esterase [Terribacillus saccharophilus]PAF34365.1 esterase [Terribacillus saccharophilus]PAF37538.1 esterase [Terribacillus saccharophilus]
MNFSNTLMEQLQMRVVEANKDQVVMEMPVGPHNRQPMGFLHGGASVALAETAASIGGNLHADPATQNVFGLEINANHIRSVRSGIVTAVASPIHVGKSTMVWQISISDENEDLLCIARCTLAVKTRRQ